MLDGYNNGNPTSGSESYVERHALCDHGRCYAHHPTDATKQYRTTAKCNNDLTDNSGSSQYGDPTANENTAWIACELPFKKGGSAAKIGEDDLTDTMYAYITSTPSDAWEWCNNACGVRKDTLAGGATVGLKKA